MPAVQDRILGTETLRAEMWKCALNAGDEPTLVQRLLSMVGSALSCNYVAFMRCAVNPKTVVVEQQWRADGSTSGLGHALPAEAFAPFGDQPAMRVSAKALPVYSPLRELFPGVPSLLVVPVGDAWAPDGYIAADGTCEQDDLFIELASIIHLRSAQLQHQAALYNSEVRYRQLFETTQAINLIIDPVDGRVVEANQAAVRFYGYAYTTLTQMHVTDLNTMSEAAVRQEINRVRDMKQGAFDTQHRLASGEIRDVTVHADRFDSPQGDMLYALIHDVTERRRTEQALRESREQYSSVVNNTKEIIFQADVEGRWTFLNPAWTEVMGFSVEESLGKSFFDTVYPDDIQVCINSIEPLTKGEKEYCHHEVRNLTKDGGLRWVEVHARLMRDATGQITGTTGTLVDSTTRKQVELALERSENLFRSITENSLDLVTILDRDSNVSYVSPSVERVLGYTLAELLGQSRFDIVHQNDLPRLFQALVDVTATTKPWPPIEVRVQDKHGSWHIFEVIGTNLLDDPAVDGIVVNARDITERKQAEQTILETEQRLRSLINSTPDIICFKDGAGRWLEANVAIRETFALGEVDYRGKTDAELADDTHPLYRQAFLVCQASDEQAWQAGGFSRGEESIPKLDGTKNVYDVIKVPTFEADGTRKGLVVLGRDVTNSKQIEQQLVQQERLAAVGQLAAGIAHDFNNILTSILGFTELLQLSPDTPASMLSSLETISNASQRAAHLVRQLLDFSRKSVRQVKQFNLVSFVQDVNNFLERTIPETIRVTLRIAPGDYLIDADPTQLHQVITNLAVNARDAMPDGGALEISLSRVTLAGEKHCAASGTAIVGEWICLAVRDTGSGIPADVLPHILEPFFTTKAVGMGTGLGLSQVYGIVQQHGGHLTIDSEPGAGTTMTIYVSPATAAQATIAPTAPPAMMFGHGETILLVEDEPSVLHVNKAMLERLRYIVVTATNGREALALYSEHAADIALVVSDVIMPAMTGDALFRALKERDPAVKMILMSGYPLGEKGAELTEQGVVAWCEKPVSFRQLSHVVGAALKQD